MNSPCQLKHFAVTRLHVDWAIVPKVKHPRGEHIECKFGVSVFKHLQSSNEFKVELRASFSEVTKGSLPHGFQVEVVIVGLLSFSPELNEETLQRLVHLNGVNVLYGTLRGIVASASGVFPFGPMIIPSLSPQEILTRTEAGESESPAVLPPKTASTRRAPAATAKN